MVRRWLCFSIGLGAGFAGSPAQAQSASDRVSLSWSAPAECPARAALEAELSALLGHGLPSLGEQELAISVSVQGDVGQGYAAKIAFNGSRGSEVRYLEHADCAQLVHAFALVIALTIDPERVRVVQGAGDPSAEAPLPPSPPPAPEPAALPLAAAPSQPMPVPERNHEPPPARSSRPGPRMALHALAGTGPLPKLGAGLQATLGLRLGQARVDAVGRYWLPREVQPVELPSVTLELGLATIGARACWLPLSGVWQLAACAGADLGELRARGSGVEDAHSNGAGFSQVAAGVHGAYTRGWLSPEFGFELSAALARPSFGVVHDGREEPLFRPANFGFSAFLGVAFEP